MTVPTITATPAATRPANPQPIGPVAAAHVNPANLPALAHVATDLDGITAPIRVVPATELGVCVECSSGPNDDHPVLDAIAVVLAPGYSDEVCAVHLHLVVAAHQLAARPATVEVPATEGRRWFERTARETYYALDDRTGIAVVRDRHDVWMVVEADSGFTYAPLCAVPIGRDGWDGARRRAEDIAQAVAAQRATEAAELADTLLAVAA